MREEKNKKPESKKKTVARKSPFEKFFIKNNKEESSVNETVFEIFKRGNSLSAAKSMASRKVILSKRP